MRGVHFRAQSSLGGSTRGRSLECPEPDAKFGELSGFSHPGPHRDAAAAVPAHGAEVTARVRPRELVDAAELNRRRPVVQRRTTGQQQQQEHAPERRAWQPSCELRQGSHRAGQGSTRSGRGRCRRGQGQDQPQYNAMALVGPGSHSYSRLGGQRGHSGLREDDGRKLMKGQRARTTAAEAIQSAERGPREAAAPTSACSPPTAPRRR